MKIAMGQMSMSEDINKNFEKTLKYIDEAKDCDLIFFPEVQMTPFFPQYENLDVYKYVLKPDDEKIKQIQKKCTEYNMYISPNVYLQLENGKFDASLWINNKGEIDGISKMVHVIRGKNFYETDYYTPSDDGFKVYDTPFGKVGIVICFDRHIPESIRTCALKGAQLIIIPTANVKNEPMEMFEYELRVQAMQNNVFIAMCNRVGKEGRMDFSGESIVINSDGDVVFKSDDKERLIKIDIDLDKTKESRKNRPYILVRREDMYRI